MCSSREKYIYAWDMPAWVLGLQICNFRAQKHITVSFITSLSVLFYVLKHLQIQSQQLLQQIPI